MPVAPDKRHVVEAVFAAHPEINTKVDGERGKIMPFVVAALGGFPWGRKAKDQGKTVFNEDGLTYKLPEPGMFEIYDIILGGDGKTTGGQPAWDYKGTFRDGENGWFADIGGSTGPGETKPTQPASDIAARLSTIEAELRNCVHFDQPIGLRTKDKSMFVCAEGGGGGEVNATRGSLGGWEQFLPVKPR